MQKNIQESREGGESKESLKEHFNRETAKISWKELQRYYARGVVIGVKDGMDLIETAIEIHQDNKDQVEKWLCAGDIFKVDDQTAEEWLNAEADHWAVVVAPWVLVQLNKSG